MLYFLKGVIFTERSSCFNLAQLPSDFPPNYLALERNFQTAVNENKLLHDRCQILEHLLRSVEISPMSNIIEEYKSMSNFYLRQLVKEIEIYRSSSDERSQLIDFLHYLRSVTREVEEILIVDEP